MMVSDKFMLNSDAARMAAARYATEDFASKAKLDKRDTLRLELLVEETLGMAKTMLDEFYGQIWFVADGKACEIHFEATADMNADKKDELLSVSSSGKNASTKGFMAKLGEGIPGTLRSASRTMDAYGQETMHYGIVHTPTMLSANSDMMTIWTLQTYRNGLDQARGANGAAEEAWDELEKSVVTHVADEIKVFIRGGQTEMTIIKKLG